MRSYKTLLLILGLLLIFVAASVLLGRRTGRPDPIRDHSSLRTNAWGTKALAELARKSGLQVAVWDQSLERLSASQCFLCLLDPSRHIGRDQQRALLDWVRTGGTLLLGTELDETHNLTLSASAPNAGPDATLLAALGLRGEAKARENGIARPAASAPELREVKTVLVPGRYRLRPSSAAEFQRLQRQLPKENRERVQLAPLVTLKWETLLTDASGAVLLRATHGRGQIYVLSEADVLSNGTLAKADNVVLAANLLFATPDRKVYFDEAIHMVRTGLSEEAQALDPRLAYSALFAVMAALILYLVSRGWRFGSPVPLHTIPRRSAIEFVNALAELYRRAGAGEAVKESLRQSLRRKLATAAGVAPDLPPEVLAAAVATARPVNEAELATLLRQLEPSAPPSDQELLALTRQMAHFEEALTHGRRQR
ncbi:MAG: DUF4350 domain-containing protein [Armatimonadota bacterium]